MARRLVLVLALGALLLGGCRVEATAVTKMRANGSGVVEAQVDLDPEAVRVAEAGGAKLEARIVVSDLAAAGWTVDPWVRRPDGSALLVARKPFAKPGEVSGIYREISGANGPFRSVFAGTRDGLLSNEWTFDGSLDLSQPSAEVSSDTELAQKIATQGFDQSRVQQLLSSTIGASLVVRNRVELPNAQPKTWTGVRGKAVPMKARSAQLDTGRAFIIGGGVALIALGLGLFLFGEARSRRVQRRGTRGR